MRKNIPENGTHLFFVGENAKKSGIPLWVFETVVEGEYYFGTAKGFKTLDLPDYSNGVFPRPCYWRQKDLDTKVFFTREEGQPTRQLNCRA